MDAIQGLPKQPGDWTKTQSIDLSALKQKVDLPHAGKAKMHISNVLSLLSSEAAVRVNTPMKPADTQELGRPVGPTGTPCIDMPDDEKAKAADLAKLIMYLKLEGDKMLSEMAKRRVEASTSELETRHNEQKAKLMDSLKSMDKAASANLGSKILAWVSAVVATAVSIALTALSGGGALPIAMTVITGVTSFACATLTTTGTMQDWTEAMAESLKKNCGHSEKDAQIWAAVCMSLIQLAVTLGPAIGVSIATNVGKGAADVGTKVGEIVAETTAEIAPEAASVGVGTGAGAGANVAAGVANAANAGSKVSESTLRTANFIAKVVTCTVQGGGLLLQGHSTAVNYAAGKMQAETTRLEKFLAIVRQHMEESQEELEEIINLVQNDLKAVAEILASKTNVEMEIAQKYSQMV